jgi:hypothetical protein
MRSIFICLLFTLSFQCIADDSYPLGVGPMSTTCEAMGSTISYKGDPNLKLAELAVNDAQEYYNSGNISPLLEQFISNIKFSDKELSNEEALEIVIERAEKMLNDAAGSR